LSDNWYLEDEFWGTFGPLMFNEASFAEAAEQVEQLIKLAAIEPGRVLDLGCGPGRHALPLARKGYPVTAVDTSALLLDQLAEQVGDLPIEIVRADMREFVPDQACDLVLVMWTSFGYFEHEAEHAQVLDNIRRSLTDNGRLILDLVGLEYLCRNLQPVHLSEYEDDRLLIERPNLVDDMTRLDNEWLLIDGDRVERAEFSHRVWSAAEIRTLLADHGLEVCGLYGSYDGADYDLEAERLIVVAGKGE
jgi:SAM-dependent methyltransferase